MPDPDTPTPGGSKTFRLRAGPTAHASRELFPNSTRGFEPWALITATAGDVIDVRAVEDRIRSLCDRFDVREVAFDPYLARQSLATLGEEGLPVVEHRQVPSLMTPAIAELERAIIGNRFRHGGHEVLR